MTEEEKINQVTENVKLRRKYARHIDYCTECGKKNAMYVMYNVTDMSSECENCYAKKYLEKLDNFAIQKEDLEKWFSDFENNINNK